MPRLGLPKIDKIYELEKKNSVMWPSIASMHIIINSV